jgi:hypothetical protein
MSSKSDQSTRVEQSPKTEQTEKSDQSTRVEQSPKTEQTDKAKRDSGLRPRINPSVDLATAVTLAGFVAYGFLRVADQLFYSRLDAKPEDVGLGYVETLSQALIILGIFFFLVFVLFGTWATIRIGKSIRDAGGNPARYARQHPGSTLVYCGELLLLLLIAVVAGKGLREGLPKGIVPMWFFGAIGLIIYGMYYERSRGRPAVGGITAAKVTPVLILLLALSSGVVFYVEESASQAIIHGQTRGPAYGRPWLTPFFPWIGERAEVHWLNGSSPPGFRNESSDCLMFLGHADNTNVFYDARTGRSVRVPITSATITVHQQAPPCEGLARP